ncbi:MAG: nicotinamide-nucleotide amidase [Alphaproteobacteria bacterium]
MYFSKKILELSERLIREAGAANLTVTTAESCTGGLIAAALTEVPGSSAVFHLGFVTYANEAKTDLLGVEASMIVQQGAVSEEVARAMATGARHTATANCAVAVTGIAGPDGGSADKPVGLVHIAAAGPDGKTLHERQVFSGARSDIRSQAVEAALKLLLRSLTASA